MISSTPPKGRKRDSTNVFTNVSDIGQEEPGGHAALRKPYRNAYKRLYLLQL